MSFGYTSATGGIHLTVQRFKQTEFVVPNPPMRLGRETRQLAAEREHKRSRMVKSQYKVRYELDASAL